MPARALLLAAAVAVSAGCGGDDPTAYEPLDRTGLHIRYPVVDGFSRSFAVFVPESVDLSGLPVAAILVLHGFPPVDMSVVTGMNETAERLGFIAVYPKSNAGAEWAMACPRCSPNAVAGVDDVAYFRALVRELLAIAPVDPGRVYLTGFSNGGMMTYRAACDLADVLAGFAPVGAGMWTWHIENCRPRRAVPIMMVNGTEDPQFPWDGVAVEVPLVGGDLQVPVPEHVAAWAEINGCRAEPTVHAMPDRFDDGTRAERRSYEGCGAETLFYVIEGGGHTWPGMAVDFVPELGTKSLELTATDSIAAFLLRQRR